MDGRIKDHEHVYVEEQEPTGRLVLPPCLVCGLTAMDALERLRRSKYQLRKELIDLRMERYQLREELQVTEGRTDGLEVEIAELEAALSAARHWHEQLDYDEALNVIDGVMDGRRPLRELRAGPLAGTRAQTALFHPSDITIVRDDTGRIVGYEARLSAADAHQEEGKG